MADIAAFPAGVSAKRKRVRWNWPNCMSRPSRLSMRYGHVREKKLVFSAWERCKKPDMKDMSRLCECGSG